MKELLHLGPLSEDALEAAVDFHARLLPGIEATLAGLQGSARTGAAEADDQQIGLGVPGQLLARAQAQRRDHPPQRLQRRVGEGVDRLRDDEDDTGGTPLPGEDLDPVEDQPSDEQQEEDVEQQVEDGADEIHALLIPEDLGPA